MKCLCQHCGKNEARYLNAINGCTLLCGLCDIDGVYALYPSVRMLDFAALMVTLMDYNTTLTAAQATILQKRGVTFT